MPEENYVWLPRQSLLTFEELDRLAGIFAGLGVHRFRLTGGEPLLRMTCPRWWRCSAAGRSQNDAGLIKYVLADGPEGTQWRFPGFALELHRSEAEGYFLQHHRAAARRLGRRFWL